MWVTSGSYLNNGWLTRVGPYLPSTSAEGDDNEEDGDEVPNGYTVYIYFKDG